MRLFSSKLVSATSSSPLLELWCITTLLPSMEGLELIVILPLTLADQGDPYGALWGVLSPSPSVHAALHAHHASLPQAQAGHAPLQPGASRGRAKAGAMLQFMGLAARWGTELWYSSLLGDFLGEESETWWSSSSTSNAFSRNRSKLVPGSPFVCVCVSVCVCVWRGKQGKYPAPKNDLVKFCRAGEAQHPACLALSNCAGQVPSSDVYGGFFLRAESLHLCFQFKFSHKFEQKACKVQHLPNCPI